MDQLKQLSVQPRTQWNNAAVMYYWDRCKNCKSVAKNFVDVDGLPLAGVDVGLHRLDLQRMGVPVRELPQVVMYGPTGYPYVVHRDHLRGGMLNVHAKLQAMTVPPQPFQNTLVLYYNPSCPYCIKMLPEFVDIEGAKAVNTAAYDGVLQSLPRPSQTVPYVVYYDHSGEMFPYTGNRTKADMEQFMQSYRLTGGRIDGVRDVAPSDIQPDTMAFYYMPTCGHCQRMEPVVMGLQLPENVNTEVVKVDVTRHPDALSGLLEPVGGVPHVVYHGQNGIQIPYSGDRSAQSLVEFIQHNQGVGDVHGPALMYYYSPTCPHCRDFAPAFLGLQGQTDVPLVTANVRQQPGVLSRLNQPATTVPHVVYFDKAGDQFPYSGERTTDGLLNFLGRFSRHVRFSGEELQGGAVTTLSSVLDGLNDKAQSKYGRDLFTPETAGIPFVGLARDLTDSKKDRVFIMLMPKHDHVVKNFPVFATVWGTMKGKMQFKIMTGKNPRSVWERKKNGGYRRAPKGHFMTQSLLDMGYDVRVPESRKSRVLSVVGK